MKTLGILGGMGPQATIKLYQEIINLSHTEFGAKSNNMFPHLIISNLPVTDLISDQKAEEQTVEQVRNEALKLHNAGSDYLLMPCNTMHKYQSVITHDGKLPFISIVDETVQHITHSNLTKVGLLGSRTLIKSEIYQKALDNKNITVITPDNNQQQTVIKIIKSIIAQKAGANEHKQLLEIIEEMQKKGTQGIVLGCTELPLIADSLNASIPIFDTLKILAKAACKKAFHE